MNRQRVVVLGASGFVGTALTEQLWERGDIEVVPVIHSSASAWRLARWNRPLFQLDVSNQRAVEDLVEGASAVVNCTRGSRNVMIDGFKTVLRACRRGKVARFVHLSSVLVYGDLPDPKCAREDGPVSRGPGANSYGALKLEQDELVEAEVARGLSSVVLCPPNITGPYSDYLLGLVNSVRLGQFARVGDGLNPCNLVDVRNLCHAIALALDAPGHAGDGKRIFITDERAPAWDEFIGEVAVLWPGARIRSVSQADVADALRSKNAPQPTSLARTLRHLVSSDVRAALRKDPLLAKADALARGAVAALGRNAEAAVRRGVEGPLRVARPDRFADISLPLCAQQLRAVRHLADKARSVLGYEPPITFEQSMKDFRSWYRTAHGIDSPTWRLTSRLYARP